MPSLRDPLLDERFEQLVAELRSARPAASPGLRDRVAEAARAEPAPRRSRLAGLRPTGRRLAPVLAGAALLGAAVAGIALFGNGGADRGQEMAGEAAQPVQADDSATLESVQRGAPEASEADRQAVTPPPSPGRLQDYRVELTLRVDDLDELSSATSRAMRIARTLRGYVVSATYVAPEGPEGESRLVLRVPVTHVQEAVARLSALGTIASQRIELQDLQQTANAQAEAIERTRGTIARLEEQLERPGLSDEERAVLRSRLADARRELGRLEQAREQTVQRGRLARITLTLTTRAPEEAPTPPGEAEQTLRDAVGALEQLVVWMLAAVIVASPVLVLGGAGLLAWRRVRRRADERLLERS